MNEAFFVFQNLLWALCCVWSMKLYLKGLHLTPWNIWELGIKSVPWQFAETLPRSFKQKWQGQTPLQHRGTLNRSRLVWRNCWLRGWQEESSQNTHIVPAPSEYDNCNMSFVFNGIFLLRKWMKKDEPFWCWTGIPDHLQHFNKL